MPKHMKKGQKTLTDTDITTSRPGRRAFLGLMVAGGAAAVSSGQAQAADTDSGGNYSDAPNCPRGIGGVYTGSSDFDAGSNADAGGFGRGAPYC